MTAPKKKPEPGAKPEYQVIEDKLYVQTEEGELIFPLRLKTKLIRGIRNQDVDEIDQFFLILDGIGAKETIDKVDELDIIKTTEIVMRYFEEFSKLQEASLGESSGSSSS